MSYYFGTKNAASFPSERRVNVLFVFDSFLNNRSAVRENLLMTNSSHTTFIQHLQGIRKHFLAIFSNRGYESQGS
jgi:hypothetical protein